MRVAQDGTFYLLDRDRKIVTHYDGTGNLTETIHLPEEYQATDIPDFGIWDHVLVLPVPAGFMTIDGGKSSTIQFDGFGANAGFASCSLSADRHFEITPKGTLLLCLQGLAPTVSVVKYQLGQASQPSIYYGADQAKNEYGVTWQSLVGGWDGSIYIQRGSELRKLDEDMQLVSVVTRNQAARGTLIGVDSNGYMYFEENLDTKKPRLYKADPAGGLVWVRDRPFMSEQLPEVRGLITPNGDYVWLTDPLPDSTIQLKLCHY